MAVALLAQPLVRVAAGLLVAQIVGAVEADHRTQVVTMRHKALATFLPVAFVVILVVPNLVGYLAAQRNQLGAGDVLILAQIIPDVIEAVLKIEKGVAKSAIAHICHRFTFPF